jgi:DNA-binding CsgD family transcriptional regulator
MKEYFNQISRIQDFIRSNNLDLLFENYAAFSPPKEVGDYKESDRHFFYIFDVPKTEIVYVSPSITNLLGYNVNEINLKFLYSKVHSDDMLVVSAFIKAIYEYLYENSVDAKKNSIRIDYRLQCKNGQYIRVLRDSTILATDSQNRMLYNLSRCTDISSIKMEGEVEFKVYGPDISNFKFSTKPFYEKAIPLTGRQLEIVELIKKGKTSKEIALILGITPNTVNTQRRRILERTGTKNIAELIEYLRKFDK